MLKKILAIMLCVLMVCVAFAGCSHNDNPNDHPPVVIDDPSSAPTDTTVPDVTSNPDETTEPTSSETSEEIQTYTPEEIAKFEEELKRIQEEFKRETTEEIAKLKVQLVSSVTVPYSQANISEDTLPSTAFDKATIAAFYVVPNGCNAFYKNKFFFGGEGVERDKSLDTTEYGDAGVLATHKMSTFTTSDGYIDIYRIAGEVDWDKTDVSVRVDYLSLPVSVEKTALTDKMKTAGDIVTVNGKHYVACTYAYNPPHIGTAEGYALYFLSPINTGYDGVFDMTKLSAFDVDCGADHTLELTKIDPTAWGVPAGTPMFMITEHQTSQPGDSTFSADWDAIINARFGLTIHGDDGDLTVYKQ